MSKRARRALASLSEGQTLHQSLVSAFGSFGARTGAFYLLGGVLSKAAYHVATPHDCSARVIEYGEPIDIEGDAMLVRATGSYGRDPSGNAVLHVHGVIAEDGVRAHGGHISPSLCVIGAGGVRALLLASVGFELRHDVHTRFATFFPCVGGLNHA